MALHNGIPLDEQSRRNAAAVRIVNAGATLGVAHAVIRACQHVTVQLTGVQRRKAMRADIAEGDDSAILLSVNHHLFIQKGAREGLSRNLAAPRRAVPSVP